MRETYPCFRTVKKLFGGGDLATKERKERNEDGELEPWSFGVGI